MSLTLEQRWKAVSHHQLYKQFPIDFKGLYASVLMVKVLCKRLGMEPFGQAVVCCPDQLARRWTASH